MKLSQQSLSVIESAFRKSISRYMCGCGTAVLTDIYVQPNQETGELFLYNDEDEELVKENLEEFKNYQGEDFYTKVEKVLKLILNKLKEEGLFENLTIMKPYSFVLVDMDKETVSDLLLIDDDTLVVDDELLKGLDKELDDFLQNLLEN